MRQWVKLRERNEALDLEVYALAALYIGGPALLRDLVGRAARFARPAVKGQVESATIRPAAPSSLRPRRRSWVLDW